MRSNYQDIKEYLLGGLAPEDRERIELQIIEDDEFGIEAQAAEDHLIESYIDGELTEAEAESFRSNYLVSEDRARRVRELAAFHGAAARKTVAPAEPPGWTLSGFFSGLSPIPAFASIALLVVVGIAAWIYLSGERPTSLETEYAALNRSDLSDASKLSQYTAVELLPGTFRSGDTGSTVRTAEASEAILFSLPLTFDPPASARFRVDVTREGTTVFSVPEATLFRDSGGSEVRVLLPKESIAKRGQYQISLLRNGSDASPVVFGFTSE